MSIFGSESAELRQRVEDFEGQNRDFIAHLSKTVFSQQDEARLFTRSSLVTSAGIAGTIDDAYESFSLRDLRTSGRLHHVVLVI